jgi:hypothetical protein
LYTQLFLNFEVVRSFIYLGRWLQSIPSKLSLRAEFSATVSLSSLLFLLAIATVAVRLPFVATMSLGYWVLRSCDSKVDVTAADKCNRSTTNGCKGLLDLVGGFLVGSLFECLVGLLDVVVAAVLHLGNMISVVSCTLRSG